MFGKCYNVPMSMLHACGYHGCETLTLSAYCFEHDGIIRAQIEAERVAGRDHRTPREGAEAPQSAA